MRAFKGSVPIFCAPAILLCPEKFVLNIYHNKYKNLASLTVDFALETRLQACFVQAYTFKLVAF